MKITLDKRPRCKSRGDFLGDAVPCDLHRGHEGKHLWQRPMSFEEYEWTDEKPSVRAL